MIPLDVLAVFVAASAALALAPGPDNIFVLTQSALHGCWAGICVTLGLCSGLVIHTLAVTFGVAAIFQTSALAFNILKFAGAVYLLYLAWRSFSSGAMAIDEAPETLPWQKMYTRGVVMNVTNPKVAIFFLAFLPQFADPAAGSLGGQIMLLGAVFIAVAFLLFSAIACFAGLLGERLKGSPRAQVLLNYLAGTVFVALALRLAVSER